METQVRTPQMVFMHPQRLVVPLFQRPYVWNAENQWEPLWNDIVRIAERVLADPIRKHHPHFLGAVVLQQVQNPVGTMQERTIIDGQQRLTTLQLFFDALHSQLVSVGAEAAAMRLETLVINAKPFCRRPEDQFKVWPTNRDRPAFNEVMAAEIPVDYGKLNHTGERMVQAHRYFGDRAAEWLAAEGEEPIEQRAAAIETAVRDLLQMVVIDLNADENAQEIFETLNARGAQLTAADLIKNFIFQKLLEAGADVEKAYEKYWKEFETAFWESEISVGRLRYPRSSIFLNHWLVAQTSEEVVAREVFTRFKRYSNESGQNMEALLSKIDKAAEIYRSFVVGGSKLTGPMSQLELFAYRTGVLESEVVKPLVLCLLDPDRPTIVADQLAKSLSVVESWMVRRMLVRASTKSYTQLIAEVISLLEDSKKRSVAGNSIEKFLANQKSDSRYWPDDNEIIEGIRMLPAYRRLRRGRLRMVLEAIEDHLRGWTGDSDGLGGERVTRGKLAIEHIMPRKWNVHWPHPNGARGEVEREALIHTIGNLTLLTSKLNSKVSNGPWVGEPGKRQGLEAHDVLVLNRELSKNADNDWTDNGIRTRSDELATLLVQIWPVPAGHKSGFSPEKVRIRHRVDLSDLISAGCINPGDKLYPRRKKHAEKVAVLLPDGRMDIDGSVYASPSEASKALTGKPTNGWWFFLVDKQNRQSLRDLRTEYLESISAYEDDVELDDEGDD